MDIVPPHEVEALCDFYNSTNGKDWNWDGPDGHWNCTHAGANPYTEQWQGLYYDRYGNNIEHVTYISLDMFNLRGTIPPSLGNLTYLIDFDVETNYLTGTIPSTFGNLSYLEYIEVGENQLSGVIPDSFGNLTSLLGLLLYDNAITGTLPASQCSTRCIWAAHAGRHPNSP